MLAGVSEKTATQITGYKTPSVFDRYDIVNEADVRAALASLADANAAGTKRDNRDVLDASPIFGGVRNARLLKELVPEEGIEPTRGVNPTGF